jgi:hypothetical protein
MSDPLFSLVLPAQQTPILAIQTPARPNIALPSANVLSVAIPARQQPILQLIQPIAVFQIVVSDNPGPPGPPGPRGSMFLGGYPSLANLPVPDGIDILPGDFAFVQDTSTIYEVK